MFVLPTMYFISILVLVTTLGQPIQAQDTIQILSSPDVKQRSIHNVDFIAPAAIVGKVNVIFAHCAAQHVSEAYHYVAAIDNVDVSSPIRLIWSVPEKQTESGCLLAFHKNTVVGRSEKINISQAIGGRDSLASVADPQGAWFDGITYMQSRNLSVVDVADAKNKSIVIIGAGISGLFTAFLLDSVGLHNWKIYEASGRAGGRIKTVYFNGSNPDQYQYSEMGAMRFPWSIRYHGSNISLPIKDNRLVEQLVDKLNQMEHMRHSPLKFSTWIQTSLQPLNDSSPSSKVRIPIKAPLMVKAKNSNTSDITQLKPSTQDFRLLATDIFQAHKEAVQRGDLQWSEANYLRYILHVDANETDVLTKGDSQSPLWSLDPYGDFEFGNVEWKTIDKGLESIIKALLPLVDTRLTYRNRVSGLVPMGDKINVIIKGGNHTEKKIEYDYAVVAVPFTKVRIWHPMPKYSSLLRRSIERLNYVEACKVSLMYKSRFWEKIEEPYFGGSRSVTEIPGIGSIIFPSYKLGSSGPGVIIANYVNGTMCRSLGALSEREHVDMIQAAMIELFGGVAEEQYTGIYERQIWHNDEYAAGAWTNPLVDQQELYLPAYYRTEFKTIFVGEHTSVANAWVWSAMESSIRGTVQLLLDLGLVSEAKLLVQEWMARWIDI